MKGVTNMKDPNPAMGAAFIEVVENQIRENNPPITKLTFNRLTMEGYSMDEAKRLIAAVLAQEIFTMMQKSEVFNEKRYTAVLQRLPELPEE
jgi:hypothetical protein